ncbi:MAG: hypothetical protein JST82_10835 [Bacteroidetes bacterium]|nr:hypothetical protein [Bacteroidota bacterium]
MSSRKLIGYTTMFFAAAVFMVVACKKKDAHDPANLTKDDDNYAYDDSRIQRTFEDVQSIGDEAFNTKAVNLKGGSILGVGCATVNLDTAKKAITIDFGKTNCLCKDGRYRRGIIYVTYTKNYNDSGSYHNISFKDYYVDDNMVSGSKTVANMGPDQYGRLYFGVHIDGGLILGDGSGTISRVGSYVRTFLEGSGTIAPEDDKYQITGSGSLTRASGKTYTVTIKSGLVLKTSCNWITEGIVEYVYAGRTTSLDYGLGGCDDQAKLNVNGNYSWITLR